MFNRSPMFSPLNSLYGAVPKAAFSWGGLLSNTQKTLSIINQAIPVFYQVKPIWNNAKTMFRVMGEMSKINNNRSNTSTNDTNTTTVSTPKSEEKHQTNEPNFFI